MDVTHAGSLPRTKAVMAALDDLAPGDTLPHDLVDDGVDEVVRRQVECGVTVVSDGEMNRPGFSVYVTDRMSGFHGETRYRFLPQDLIDFPGFAMRSAGDPSLKRTGTPACTAPIEVADRAAVERDVARLQRAIDRHQDHADGRLSGFMSVPSPGVLALYFEDQYYGDPDAYVTALADALRHECATILASGLQLQIDAPDLAMGRHVQYADASLDDFRDATRRNVAAIDRMLAGLDRANTRLHVCWGNYEGPHIHDVELEDIADLVLDAAPVGGFVLEGANPRHAHDWATLRDRGWPDDRTLVAGVIDTCTNYVEHPRLVAERLVRLAEIVGRDRIHAGTDCGFGTFAGQQGVHPKIVWAKLRALAEGAELAERHLVDPDHASHHAQPLR